VKTLRFRVDPDEIGSAEAALALEQAAAILRDGGTVALPTETVYGLGANALDAVAVAKIFEAKERPRWDPMIVHVADEAMLGEVVASVPETGQKLIDAFWPGPLTMLLPRSALVPDVVTAGRSLAGVRMPAHAVALELIRRAGVPVAAPSANRFGRTSPTTAAHVLEDLDGRIDAIVDGGPTIFGVESTVVDVTSSPMIVYRPGAVSIEQIRAVGGETEMFAESGKRDQLPRSAMPSPGVGLRHYAPDARLVLIDCEYDDLAAVLRREVSDSSARRLGIMMPAELGTVLEFNANVEIFEWGEWSDPNVLARRLFAGLRHLDLKGCDLIFCPVPQAVGIGAAMRDRLLKAAWQD
jgi:L-threonylcarbamoyladenylate synthase